jgi:hypothetical protein
MWVLPVFRVSAQRSFRFFPVLKKILKEKWRKTRQGTWTITATFNKISGCRNRKM